MFSFSIQLKLCVSYSVYDIDIDYYFNEILHMHYIIVCTYTFINVGSINCATSLSYIHYSMCLLDFLPA